jgi:hypothetical protein
MNDQTSFQVETSFASLAGIFCWTAKKINMSKKIIDLVGSLAGWFVCTIFIMHLLWKIAKLTYSLRSLVCLQSFTNKNHTRSPNAVISMYLMILTIAYFVSTFLAVRYNDRYVLVPWQAPISLVLVILTGPQKLFPGLNAIHDYFADQVSMALYFDTTLVRLLPVVAWYRAVLITYCNQ